MDRFQMIVSRQLLSRKGLYTFAFILAAFGLIRLYYALTDDFRLANIIHSLPYQENWAIRAHSEDKEKGLRSILAQKFTYLDKGSQSYAFESSDGKYVLKFFKFKHLRPSWMSDWAYSIGLFKTYYEKLAARKQRKLWGVFHAYKLAYERTMQESRLVFIQLNNIGNPSRSVTIRNKIGFEYNIDLQNLTFILQEKGETLGRVLNRILKQGNIQIAQVRIGQIFDLYCSEYNKGVYDHDHGVMRNVGFVGEGPIHLDVGKLSVDELMRHKSCAKEDALLVASKINHWMEKNYPQYAPQVAQYNFQKIHQLYD